MGKKLNFKIEMVPIDSVKPCDWNPRFMPEDERQRMADEINEFGLVENIVANRRNMELVGGHQRWFFLKSEGYDEVPVYFVDLDQKKQEKLNLALNKISGKWDEAKLKEILMGLDDYDYTGFTDEEAKALIGDTEIQDLSVPQMEEVDKTIYFEFGDYRGEVPKEVYEAFVSKIENIKTKLFPKENPKDVSVVTPLEYLIAAVKDFEVKGWQEP